MRKEEVQGLLAKFGFSVSLNKKIGETAVTHMIHVGKTLDRLVDYNVDEAKDFIKSIWAYTDRELNCIETITDLELWLGA